jgi:hypothetical protein
MNKILVIFLMFLLPDVGKGQTPAYSFTYFTTESYVSLTGGITCLQAIL